MPIKNTTKYYDAPAYYHVYNRGAGDAPIYLDDYDRQKFLSLLQRHLDPDDAARKTDGSAYPVYEVALVAYCLMGNHFHLLLYQESDPTAITKLMRSISTAYTMYFNRKYKKHGHLFQSIFKASRIDNETYLMHITRYIHMNPRSYLRYEWSSLAYYLDAKRVPVWIHPQQGNTMTAERYRQFLAEYEGKKAELELLKSQLAG